MPTFHYTAVDRAGTQLKGTIDALDLRLARNALRDQRLIVLELKGEEGFLARLGIRMHFVQHVSFRELVLLSRQLATMIDARLPVVQAFQVLAEQNHGFLARALTDIAEQIAGGNQMSVALARHPTIFSRYYISMVRAGEASGQLEVVLIKLADQLERDYELRGRVRGALTYPAVLLIVIGLAGFLMTTFVIPRLLAALEDLNVELPLATKILLVISTFSRRFWFIEIAIVAGLVIVLRRFLRTETGRRFFDTNILRVPVLGKLFRNIFMARFSKTLETLLTAGVAILEALAITGDVVGNKIYQGIIDGAIRKVRDGKKLAEAFSGQREFPSLVVQMINIGERTGRLSDVLDKMNTFYTREIDATTKTLSTLIEPILMIIIGLGVGFMVIAVLMPIFNASSGTF
ncbi:MAG: type II secretion system F family protein [Parcubacteria group bacterium]|nr:type II secretion system F family protein [Parcubacteria group bacterium]